MQDFFNLAIDKLVEAKKRYGTFESLSKAAKVDRASLSRWVSGDRKPSLYEIGKVFDAIGVTLAQTDGGAPSPSGVELVPLMSARAGAGSSLLTGGAVERTVPFSKEFFAQKGFLVAKKAFLLTVMGDSMRPSICDGDTIMVDGNDVTLKDSSIFLVGLGEELLVKMLQRTPKGWLLVSKNKDYSPIPVEGEDASNLRVYGRVRWVSRSL